MPLMLLIAASTEAAFKSGIFCVAISRTCFSVTLPTLSLLGVPAPLAMPAAFFNRTAAGGVLVIKVKAAIGVNRDDNRNDQSGHLLVLRARVELLAELHDVDLRLAQCGTDRRRGRGLAGFDLQLDVRGIFSSEVP